LLINGIEIQSASNTVNDAIPGVGLTILKPGDVVINATRDYSSIKEDLNAIVTQYNKLRQFYSQQAKGPLGGDPVLREILKDIRTVLLAPTSNGGRYQYLSEVGLELTSSGDLKLDESKLNTAIASYSGDLEKLFQGAAGSAGVFDTLVSNLRNLDGSAGLIKTTRDGIQKTLTRVDDRIEHQEQMLEVRRKALMKMFAAADEAIARLNQMTSAISNLNRAI
jgi:flagellar hook-associated protein 2